MEESHPQLIAIAGPNGAGKSTVAPFLLRDQFGLMEYVNADVIALGLSAYQPEKAAFVAGRVMLERLRDLARERKSFAFETTLSTRSYAAWVRQLKQRGYSFHVLFLWLRSPELALQRVRDRVLLGGHDVPAATVRRRYVKGVRNFFDLYQTLADSWMVYDNSVPGELFKIAVGEGHTTTKLLAADSWHRFKEVSQ